MFIILTIRNERVNPIMFRCPKCSRIGSVILVTPVAPYLNVAVELVFVPCRRYCSGANSKGGSVSLKPHSL
jgi:hypothetical protein